MAITILQASGQDNERPMPPLLKLVSVNPLSTNVTLAWNPGGSPDVAGYIIYTYLDGEGTAIDTLMQPSATSYTDIKSNADLRSIYYVVAAIDSSGNVSPLSNWLGTIFTDSQLDTCKHEISLKWNSYNEYPDAVTGYSVYYRRDNGPWLLAGNNSKTDTTLAINLFETGSDYCFYTDVHLGSTGSASSNMSCVRTDLQRPPAWINADYCSVIDNSETELSFTIDPAGELTDFRIEKSSSRNSDFKPVTTLYGRSGTIVYNDKSAGDTIFYYRLAGLNNCGEAIVYSNTASVIIPALKDFNNRVEISWNSYFDWNGINDGYRISRNHTGIYSQISVNSPGDTVFSESLYPIIMEVASDSICYLITAVESANPYTNNGISISSSVCIEAPTGITVPNAFSPNDDHLNDSFRPLLSFTPREYLLIIKSPAGSTLFTSHNHLEEWKGERGKGKVKQGVYLWFLKVVTPSGRQITKSGTVTAIF